MADVFNDAKVLKDAAEAAKKFLSTNPFDKGEHEYLFERITRYAGQTSL